MEIISREPVTYFIIHVKGMLRTLIDPGVTEYLILFKHYQWSGGLLGQILDQGLFVTFKGFTRSMPIFFVSLLTLTGLFLVVLYCSTALAMFQKGLPHGVSTVVIVCILAYYLLISGGPVGYHRFRLPIMPLICVFSGYGLYLLHGRLRRTENGNLLR